MTDAVANTSSLNAIMSEMDLGPTGSVQFMFAKLQLAQSQICKNQAEDYMKQIEDIQKEQQQVADLISQARQLQNEADEKGGCTVMPDAMKDFMTSHGLAIDEHGHDDKHNKDEWTFNIESLTNYQESISNKTQTLMVYLQDFIGQYNSYLQGANSAISTANQTLTAIATGR